MSHYLVTGGLGVVGSLFARHVVAQGHRVTVVDDGRAPRHDWVAGQLQEIGVAVYRCSVECYLGSIAEPHFGFILHAAASTGIPYSTKAPDDDWARNAETTRILMQFLRECRTVPRTVVLSSVKPCSTRALPLTEDSPIDPDEPYAASKAAQAAVCQAWARTYDLPVWVLRCSNLYGPAPCHGPRHGWLTWFCIQAALGWPIEIQGTGQQSRDMLYSDDLIAAIMALFDTKAPPPNGELFLMGGGKDCRISVEQAVNHLRLGVSDHLPLVAARYTPGRQHEDQHVWVDTSKFEAAFPGWHANTEPTEGMDRVVTWAREHADELRKVYREFAP